jgi:sporulation protein YlmC with PRC-barrel domain
MKKRVLERLVPALMVAIAGTCLAQNPTQPNEPAYDPNSPNQPQPPDRRQPERDRDRDRNKDMRDMDRRSGQQVRSETLIRGKNILGAKIVNNANEKLGTIDDLLLDGRSGNTVYGILSHGGLLGIGDKLIAIPFSAMKVLPTSDGDATVQIDATKESLTNAPSFKKDEWPLIGEKQWMEKSHSYFGAEPANNGGWGRESAVTRDWNQGKNLDFKGRVDRIETRTMGRGMNEAQVITVQGDGKEQVVVVGPAWFLQGQGVPLKEGDQVEVHGREMRFADGTTVVAREITVQDGNTLRLRDNSGMPIWDTSGPPQGNMRSERGGQRTYIRATELKGKDVLGTGGNKVGDVSEFAFSPTSGRVPLLIVKVGGLAGMGSREVVVPWDALQYTKQGEKLAINADEETLKGAPQLDKAGFAAVNDPEFRQRVHSFFGYGGADNRPGMRGNDRTAGGWTRSSDYNKLFTSGEKTTVNGTVVSLGHAPPMKGMSDAATIKVRTDQGEKTVQLGPTWFINRQDLRFMPGEQVTIKGVRANVEGEEVILATEVSTNEGMLRLRTDDGRPNWDALGAEQERENRRRDRNP